MSGLFRAELLRLRKRRALQVVVFSVLALATFFFVVSFTSIYDPPPFNAAEYRQMLVDEGMVIGLPPEDAERLLDEMVSNERQNQEMLVQSQALTRAGYVLPYSLVTEGRERAHGQGTWNRAPLPRQTRQRGPGACEGPS